MKVAIRVDASASIGSGHMARCLCIADLLRARGAEIHFLCLEVPQHLAEHIDSQNYGLTVLPPSLVFAQTAPQAPWSAHRQCDDANFSISALANSEWDWLIVDHYGLDYLWEMQLIRSAKRLMAIDDLGRQHTCDLLLDQNLQADPASRYEASTVGKKLLGPHYALLRPEFAVAREQAKPRDGAVKRLHVFMGGMDADNATAKMLRAIDRLQRPNIQLDVVIGVAHPARDAIKSYCDARPGTSCHIQVSNMAELLVHADLAVGAGGSATWERCALGVPTFAVQLAQNQHDLLSVGARRGVLYTTDGALEEENLAMHLGALLDNTGLRNHISREAYKLVDGHGARRVVAELMTRAVSVRVATPADSDSVYAWRNADTVRAVSHQTAPIAYRTHQLWFDAVLGDEKRHLLIGEQDGSAAGVVRFDIDDARAEVSIYLRDERRGELLGKQLLSAAETWLAKSQPQVTTVLAQTLGDNQYAQRLFIDGGYTHDTSGFSKRVSEA